LLRGVPAGGSFDRVVLIYNPLTRRIPLALAETVLGDLHRRLPDAPVTLQATERAGHARELASVAAAVGRPLIVAVGADGGFNEVVNGVLDVAGSAALTSCVTTDRQSAACPAGLGQGRMMS
jgi:diacylglycerol kinase (ATP)